MARTRQYLSTRIGRGTHVGSEDGVVALIARLWNVHAPLTLTGLLMLTFTAFFTIGVVADERIIAGAPAWLKPAKFGISIAVYTLTLTWLLGFVRTERTWLRRTISAIAWTVIAVFAVEMAVIVTQVVRGTTSHFNFATPFDAVLYSTMGAAITLLWSVNLLLAILLLFVRFDHPAFAWALRLGLAITVLGMALGFLMTMPTAQQMASWEAGAPVTVMGAHGVAVPRDAEAIPVLGWSTQGGDLRVPHFVGMHALQVIPLIGWLVVRRRGWTVRQQTGLVWAASGGYLAWVGLVTWQALRGQSVLAPDTLTLMVGVTIVAGTLLAGTIALRPAKSQRLRTTS